MNAALQETCVLIADRHTVLLESMRDLLHSAFDRVYIVGDAPSLMDGVSRLRPAIVVLDLSSVGGEATSLIRSMRRISAGSKLIALSLDDSSAVAQAALDAGADAVVLKRRTATDLLAAVDALAEGRRYISDEFNTETRGALGA